MQETTVRSDVYSLVTERIIELLEQGTVPWQKPWTTSGIPTNLITGRAYRGINLLLLAHLSYEQNFFLTWNQAKEHNVSIKKGEKAHFIVYWSKKDKPNTERDEEEVKDSKAVLRYYWVFNVAQCEGIPPKKKPAITKPNIPIDACEEILASMPNRPIIRHKESKAYYEIEEDYINMPKLKAFKTSESYYCTLFHELIHSTGHQKRLNRKEINEMAEFGSELYSKEELVAEMGACYLGSLAGIIQTFQNDASYIDGWLQKLKNDRRFIIFAASFAQCAVDYIVGGPPKETIVQQ